MDPIHPILPVPPNIPPVTEAPRVGKIDRDQRRDPRREGEGKSSAEERRQPVATDDVVPVPDGEPRPHIDVTA